MADRSSKSGTCDATHNAALANRLSLRHGECAAAIGISPRLLSSLTDEGVIPHVRLSKRLVIYPVAPVQQWLADEASKAGKAVQS